jgi:hypothetical protein
VRAACAFKSAEATAGGGLCHLPFSRVSFCSAPAAAFVRAGWLTLRLRRPALSPAGAARAAPRGLTPASLASFVRLPAVLRSLGCPVGSLEPSGRPPCLPSGRSPCLRAASAPSAGKGANAPFPAFLSPCPALPGFSSSRLRIRSGD